jgi:hypothetical protein
MQPRVPGQSSPWRSSSDETQPAPPSAGHTRADHRRMHAMLRRYNGSCAAALHTRRPADRIVAAFSFLVRRLEGMSSSRLRNPTNIARYVRDWDQQGSRRCVGSSRLAPTIQVGTTYPWRAQARHPSPHQSSTILNRATWPLPRRQPQSGFPT